MGDTKSSSLVVIPRSPDWGAYLAYVAPQGKAFEGRYRLPGGKLKPGETFDETLQRELLEEYGVSLRDIDLLYTKGNTLGGTLYLCSAHCLGDPISRESDVGSPEWLAARDVFSSNMVPNCKLGVYAYLLKRDPAALQDLHATIVSDEEFIAHLQREASDLYRTLFF